MANEVKAGGAYVEISARLEEWEKGLKRAQAKFKEFGENLQKIGEPLAVVGDVVAGTLIEITRKFAENGAEIARASKVTGVAAETLSRLKYAGDQVDVSFQSLTGGVVKMQKAIYELGQGNKQTTDAFSKLGLSMTDLAGKSPDAQLATIADRLNKVQDEGTRTALTMEIFGKSGADLKPLLDQGSAGISAMEKQSDKLGYTMSGPAAEAAEKFAQAQKSLRDAITGASNAIGAALAPALTSITQTITGYVVKVGEFIGRHQQAIITVTAVAGVVGGLGTALVTLGVGLKAIGVAMEGFRAACALATGIMELFAKSEEETALATTALEGSFLGPVGLVAGIAAGVAAIAAITSTMKGMGDQAAITTKQVDGLNAAVGIGQGAVAGKSNASGPGITQANNTGLNATQQQQAITEKSLKDQAALNKLIADAQNSYKKSLGSGAFNKPAEGSFAKVFGADKLWDELKKSVSGVASAIGGAGSPLQDRFASTGGFSAANLALQGPRSQNHGAETAKNTREAKQVLDSILKALPNVARYT